MKTIGKTWKWNMTISIYSSLKVHFVKLQSPFSKTPKSNENLTQFLFSRLTCSQCDHNSNSSHTVKTHTQHNMSSAKPNSCVLLIILSCFVMCTFGRSMLYRSSTWANVYCGRQETEVESWNMWRRRISGKINHEDIDLDFST